MTKLRIHQPWRIALAIAIVGMMLKILHLPFSREVLLTGLVGVIILYPLHFLKKRKKSFLDYAKLFFAIFGTLHYTFAVFHWSYGYVFTRLAQLSLLVLIIAYLNHTYIDQGKKTSGIARWETILFTIAVVCIVVGAILKILHWPYGNVLLISGLVAAAIAVVLGSSSSNN